MVFLILTRSGLEDVRPRFDVGLDVAWVNGGVLSPQEEADLPQSGWDLTTFASAVHVNDLASDVGTIRLHHPGRVVWAEAPADGVSS